MALNFKRKIEDFICENCGQSIKGDGYTNHCSKCLWSKHLDTTPGDRASKCGGIMEPSKIEIKKGKYDIVHKCVKCGYEKKNRVSPKDNFDEILKISAS